MLFKASILSTRRPSRRNGALACSLYEWDHSNRRSALEPHRLKSASPMKVICELNAQLIKAEKLEYPPACSCCGQELNLHQPDESRPSQLLATCDGCCRWFSL